MQGLGGPVARELWDGGQVKLSTFMPLKIRKRGVSKVLVRPDGVVESPGTVATQIDQPLPVALTRAFYWQQLLDDGVVGSGSEIAQREGLHHSTANELLRLTLLEPAIIQSILAGQQPRCMSLLWFQRNPLPTDWVAQREVVTGFDARPGYEPSITRATSLRHSALLPTSSKSPPLIAPLKLVIVVS